MDRRGPIEELSNSPTSLLFILKNLKIIMNKELECAQRVHIRQLYSYSRPTAALTVLSVS